MKFKFTQKTVQCDDLALRIFAGRLYLKKCLEQSAYRRSLTKAQIVLTCINPGKLSLRRPLNSMMKVHRNINRSTLIIYKMNFLFARDDAKFWVKTRQYQIIEPQTSSAMRP